VGGAWFGLGMMGLIDPKVIQCGKIESFKNLI
jgi:hypothetical protein